MTPRERAEKMVKELWRRSLRSDLKPNQVDYLAAQIDEAEREVVAKELKERMANLADSKAFSEGFHAAREKAAEICEKHSYGDKCLWHCSLKIAERIREMKPQ